MTGGEDNSRPNRCIKYSQKNRLELRFGDSHALDSSRRVVGLINERHTIIIIANAITSSIITIATAVITILEREGARVLTRTRIHRPSPEESVPFVFLCVCVRRWLNSLYSTSNIIL